MPPRLRKFALTAHVMTSVGWLGAVVVFFALAIVGLTGQDAQTVRGAYLAMGSTTWVVLVPMAFASLLTGVVQSLGTQWGLFRHYWVLIKFGITVFATYVLWGYTSTLTGLADAAAATPPGGDLEMLRSPSVVVHSGVALVLLLITTTLSVYKPRGMTRYGQRKQRQQRRLRTRHEGENQEEQRPVLVP